MTAGATMIDAFAQILWNPTLGVLYLLVGAVVAIVLGGVAWRRTWATARAAWTARGGSGLGHRDAFVASLAASVGVGNVAGVATALHLGGPGALFWMWISALLGMHLRLVSTYFASRYRPADPRDPAVATPMVYFERLLPFGRRVLPRVLALLLLVAGLVNANLIQSNSVAHTLTRDFGVAPLVIAVVLAVAIGSVVLGGVQSIVQVSNRLAPWMLAAYLGAGLLVLVGDPTAVGRGLSAVFAGAFAPTPAVAGAGGWVVLRSLQYGVSRGIFSHGSGIGMAPFFQSANTDDPARGAYMAAAVPVIDTLVVCTVTGLVILSQGMAPWWTSAHLTVASFELALGLGGKLVVFACLAVFAFTTVTSWAHFAERCFVYLGGRDVVAFRLGVCAIAFAGPFVSVGVVWSAADILMGALLVVHMVPLGWLVLRHAPELWRELDRRVR